MKIVIYLEDRVIQVGNWFFEINFTTPYVVKEYYEGGEAEYFMDGLGDREVPQGIALWPLRRG